MTAGCDHLSDRELIAAFEVLALAPADVRHREHVRLAYAMLDGADFGEAAVRFRRALLAFAAGAGAAAKYHETLTWAYLVLVHRRRYEQPAAADSRAFVAENPDLLDHAGGALARSYDVAAITACPLARHVFVLPDR